MAWPPQTYIVSRRLISAHRPLRHIPIQLRRTSGVSLPSVAWDKLTTGKRERLGQEISVLEVISGLGSLRSGKAAGPEFPEDSE